MKKTLPLIVMLLALAGCNKIFLYSYGVRNPAIENARTLDRYLRSKGLDASASYVLKDTSELLRFFRSGTGMPEIRFYDRNGYLMLYRDEKKCNAQNDSLISFLDPGNFVRVDSAQKLHECLEGLRNPDGSAVDTTLFRDKDFYLVMYWAKYLGKVNSSKMSDWEQALKGKDLRLSLKVIKVSTDYMDFWHIRKEDMHRIYGRKTSVNAK